MYPSFVRIIRNENIAFLGKRQQQPALSLPVSSRKSPPYCTRSTLTFVLSTLSPSYPSLMHSFPFTETPKSTNICLVAYNFYRVSHTTCTQLAVHRANCFARIKPHVKEKNRRTANQPIVEPMRVKTNIEFPNIHELRSGEKGKTTTKQLNGSGFLVFFPFANRSPFRLRLSTW